MKNEFLQNLICILLVVALSASGVGILMQSERALPDNPISGKAQYLSAEVLSGEGDLRSSRLNGDERDNFEPENREETIESSEESDAVQETSETPRPTPEQDTSNESEATNPPEDETPNPQPSTSPKDEQDGDTPSTDDASDGNDGEAGGTEPDQNPGGGSDSGENGDGDVGGEGDGGSSGGNSGLGDGEDDNAPRIFTDLTANMYLTRTDLPDGKLSFQAYPVGDGNNLSVKVVLQNDEAPANGTTLVSSDGKNYVAQLLLNSDSYITIYLKENGENISYVKYKVSFYAEKADEDHPEIGEYPPTIITSLDGESLDITTQDLVFWVSAKTHQQLGSKTIYSNKIKVWLDGEELDKQSGDSRPEYDVHFPTPNSGEDEQHVIKVLTWDDKGNSRFKYYTVNYHMISEGIYAGTVNVVIDATAVGLGFLDGDQIDMASGETIASVVLRFLEKHGYVADYMGTPTSNFYLRRIYRGDIAYYAGIPTELRTLIERDGILINNQKDRDSLGEFDFTMGSGWMYSVNGVVYAGRAMSAYPAQSGSTIFLRFTLAYGKDIGGYDATGGGYGSLTSYCKVWINGGVQELGHDYQESDRVEPTAQEDGFIEFICSKCHETKRDIIPALGEEPEITEPPDVRPEESEPPSPEPTEIILPSNEPQPVEPVVPDETPEPSSPVEPSEDSSEPDNTDDE